MTSKRKTDDNGWLTISDNPLTKVGVFPYWGYEIGAEEKDRLYYVYRPAEELTKKETIESFKLIPFVDEHEMLGDGATPAEKKGIQGTVGEDVYFEEPYLLGNIKVLSNATLNKINSGKIELSPGYRCWYDFTEGDFNGQKYDAIQRDIRANHLALVQEGRTGKDVSVQDKNSVFTIDTSELINMNLEELLQSIQALSDEDKAKLLEALTPAQSDEDVGEMTAEEKAAAEAAAAEAEQVAEVATEAAEAAAEAAESGDKDKTAEAEAKLDEASEKADEAKEDVADAAMDSMRKELLALRKQVKAQDSKAIMRAIAGRDSLASRVSKFVGAFDHSTMTREDVAVYGVKKLGIRCEKGTESVALDAWMQAKTADMDKPTYATDSKANHASVKSQILKLGSNK